MENTLQLMPSSLVSLADEECQVLKHSAQWMETIDPTVAAMQALFTSSKEGLAKFCQLLATNPSGSSPLLKTFWRYIPSKVISFTFVPSAVEMVDGYVPILMTCINLCPSENTMMMGIHDMDQEFSPLTMTITLMIIMVQEDILLLMIEI
jgi:hypothetical protein